ncbi:MAG: radical SAM family heme chaperone HemW [Deltaproteobacteria bacterium]|nr:radical SAM family heme chaperone HemW [Deltaproteobacteria bacterium]
MNAVSTDLAGRGDTESFALYVHLPFCKRRCAYCDFVSFAGMEGVISSYIELVLKEWRAVKDLLISPASPKVTSCYLGGGTPSLLNEIQIETLVKGLFPGSVDSSMEFTIEANPESLMPSKLRCYKSLGINRISLGVQSFSDESLQKLGRIHTSRQADMAIQMICDEGWENWSLDLMYGLPDQTPGAFERDLDRALAFESPHLSAYCLTLAPGTPFGKLAEEGRLQLPKEQAILEMMDVLEEKSALAGLFQYETSNFAREGFTCAHNLTYWHLEPYVGVGVGAVSYFVWNSGPWGAHWENPTDLQAYGKMARDGSWAFMNRKGLTRKEAFMETFLTGLRLTQGIEVSRLKARFGEEMVTEVIRKITPLVEDGWLEVGKDVLRTTRRGGRVLDALLLEIVFDLD